MPDETGVIPFSNGSEYFDWRARNCDRCVLDGYRRDRKPCAMEEALSMGTILGTIPVAMAERVGATVRGDYCDMPVQCRYFRDEDAHDVPPDVPDPDPAQLVLLADPTEPFANLNPAPERVHADA